MKTCDLDRREKKCRSLIALLARGRLPASVGAKKIEFLLSEISHFIRLPGNTPSGERVYKNLGDRV